MEATGHPAPPLRGWSGCTGDYVATGHPAPPLRGWSGCSGDYVVGWSVEIFFDRTEQGK